MRSGTRLIRGSLGSTGCSSRILMAIIIAVIAIAGYYTGTREEQNIVTGEIQRVSLSAEQEIALGIRAAPDLARQYGGLEPDTDAQALVDHVGHLLVERTGAHETPYQFEFHLLADSQTINAFALPGGQIFITDALFDQLTSEAELAGILAHEIGHVVARHASERIAKERLTEGLTQAAIIASTDPDSPSSAKNAQIARLINTMVNMQYSRSDELESDRLAVRLMIDAGYDPYALISVMEILESAGGGSGQPEFMSTHPSPDNRMAEIQAAIERELETSASARTEP